MRTSSHRGFTLIELLIVTALAALLFALALPAYQRTVMRAHRAEARAALSTLLQAQERLRANCAVYASSLAGADDCASGAVGHPATSPGGLYRLALAQASANGFTAFATPVSGSSQAGDAACAQITLVLAQGDVRTTPGECW